MNTWRTLYHLARADFLERSRRTSFLITLAVIIFMVYGYLPPSDAPGVTFNLGSYRGIYNSAWIGAIVAVLCSALLSLPGFYLVKNTLQRDTDTRVGQILATTPISRPQYILGKLFSNFFFLAIMVAVILVAAIVMQFVRGESYQLDLWQFVSPFLFMTLPVMALVSAISILFETISWLRGGFGNIVYFFLYVGIVVVSVMPSQISGGYRVLPEPFGLTAIAADMSRDVKAVYPDYHGGLVIGYTPLRGEIKTFVWDGVAWNASILLMRLMYIGASLLIALLASLFFHRFDPAYESSLLKKAQPKRTAQNGSEPAVNQLDSSLPLPSRSLTPLPAYQSFPPSLFFIQFLAQVKLMLKGLRWWWYLVAAGLILLGLLAADDQTRQVAYLGAWLWPMLLWSGMGNRERQYHTNEIVFSSAHPLSRQLPAAWLAGAFVALVMASGVILHSILASQWGNLFAIVIGALFIPALAFSLGTLTGSSKLFEVIYLMLWYMGPANHLPILDYMGISPEAVSTGVPFYFLAATVLLLSLAIFGRQRQLAS